MRGAFFLLFVVVNFYAISLSTAQTRAHSLQQPELLEYLLAKALRLSGLPAVSTAALPPVYQISREELQKEVCPSDPENCRGLAAVFDDLRYRILILDSFELSDNFKPVDYSYLLHELVHAIQYLHSGPYIFQDCATLYQTEKQAYDVQDAYLAEEGAFHRAGIYLRFSFRCDEEKLAAEFPDSLRAWQSRKRQHTFFAAKDKLSP